MRTQGVDCSSAGEIDDDTLPSYDARGQCLKWAAMGKTDSEISEIIHISLPTVRFHITNAARNLNVIGRPQAIYKAVTLGYVGGVARH
jgi:DNA-binding CsgD family transcriptional regulator